MVFRACATPIAHRVGSYKKAIHSMLFKTSRGRAYCALPPRYLLLLKLVLVLKYGMLPVLPM